MFLLFWFLWGFFRVLFCFVFCLFSLAFCWGRISTPRFFCFLLISQFYSNCFTTENAYNLFRHFSSRSAERLSLSHVQTVLADQVDKHSSYLQKTTSVVCIWPLTMPTFILLKVPLVCKFSFYCSFLFLQLSVTSPELTLGLSSVHRSSCNLSASCIWVNYRW